MSERHILSEFTCLASSRLSLDAIRFILFAEIKPMGVEAFPFDAERDIGMLVCSPGILFWVDYLFRMDEC